MLVRALSGPCEGYTWSCLEFRLSTHMPHTCVEFVCRMDFVQELRARGIFTSNPSASVLPDCFPISIVFVKLFPSDVLNTYYYIPG